MGKKYCSEGEGGPVSNRRALVDIVSSILRSHPGGLTVDEIILEIRKMTYEVGTHSRRRKTVPISRELRAILASNPGRFRSDEIKVAKRTTCVYEVSIWRVRSMPENPVPPHNKNII